MRDRIGDYVWDVKNNKWILDDTKENRMQESREVKSLKKSMIHWENMRDGKESAQHYTNIYCMCCKEFEEMLAGGTKSCGNCPIAIKDGHCRHTPWIKYADYPCWNRCALHQTTDFSPPTFLAPHLISIKTHPDLIPLADAEVQYIKEVLIWQLEKELDVKVEKAPMPPSSGSIYHDANTDVYYEFDGNNWQEIPEPKKVVEKKEHITEKEKEEILELINKLGNKRTFVDANFPGFHLGSEFVLAYIFRKTVASCYLDKINHMTIEGLRIQFRKDFPIMGYDK